MTVMPLSWSKGQRSTCRRRSYCGGLADSLLGFIIFGGDFNCIENKTIDKVGGNGDVDANVLGTIRNNYRVDAHRTCFPRGVAMSLVSADGTVIISYLRLINFVKTQSNTINEVSGVNSTNNND